MAARRIMIVSPHALFREGLSHLLAESSDFELLAVVSSLVEAEAKSAATQPDVIVTSRTDAAQPIALRLLELARDQVVAMTLDNREVSVYSRRCLTLDTAQDLYQVLRSS